MDADSDHFLISAEIRARIYSQKCGNAFRPLHAIHKYSKIAVKNNSTNSGPLALRELTVQGKGLEGDIFRLKRSILRIYERKA